LIPQNSFQNQDQPNLVKIFDYISSQFYYAKSQSYHNVKAQHILKIDISNFG